MLLLLQIALYCLLYILLVKLAVKNDGLIVCISTRRNTSTRLKNMELPIKLP